MTSPPSPSEPVSRNQLCACGSGKRYKHCCGANPAKSTVATPSPADATGILDQALREQVAGHYSNAEKLYRKALELDRNNFNALHMLGVIRMERFDYAEALELLFRAAEQTGWRQGQILHNLGLAVACLMTPAANARQDRLLSGFRAWQQQLIRDDTHPASPLVSVIIQLRNDSDKELRRALESVFVQTYKNLELLIIDSSVSAAPDIDVGGLLAACPFPHRHIVAGRPDTLTALQAGAEAANGAYLTFLNPADWFSPDRVEHLVERIASCGAEWGYSGVMFADQAGIPIDSDAPQLQNILRPPGGGFARISNSFSFLDRNPCVAGENIFFQTDLFRKASRDAENISNHPLRDVCLEASCFSEPVFVDMPLYGCRLAREGRFSEAGVAQDGQFFSSFLRRVLTISEAGNDLAPAHPDNRTLLYKIALDRGMAELFPAGRLRTISLEWLAAEKNQEHRSIAHAPSPDGGTKRAIVVLGMHRSGTSAFSRVLNLCGAFLPENRHPAKLGDNEKGFWEPEEIPRLNERLFKSAGISWLSTAFDLAEQQAFHDDFIEDAIALIGTEYGNRHLILIKDPRICMMAPWWDEALRKSGYEPMYIIPVRNPLEVAASLLARDGLPVERGLALWLGYFEHAEVATRHAARVFVTYDDLMTDWKQSIHHISESLGISLDSQASCGEIDAFLDQDMRHQQSSHAALFGLTPTRLNQAVQEKYRWALQQSVSTS